MQNDAFVWYWWLDYVFSNGHIFLEVTHLVFYCKCDEKNLHSFIKVINNFPFVFLASAPFSRAEEKYHSFICYVIMSSIFHVISSCALIDYIGSQVTRKRCHRAAPSFSTERILHSDFALSPFLAESLRIRSTRVPCALESAGCWFYVAAPSPEARCLPQMVPFLLVPMAVPL